MFKAYWLFIFGLTMIATSQATAASVFSTLLAPKPAAYANNPCADIRNGQFICADCSTLGFCMQEGGDWVTVKVGPCATDHSLYCNEDAMGCVLQSKCFLPPRGIRFECQNPGKFPDPYDCRVSHSCSNLNEDTRLVCPSGSIYSPATQDCIQRSTDSDECQAQFRCDYAGMMGAWPGDANIYYVCHVKRVDGEFIYYPLMYRCPTGNYFDGKKCVSGNNPSPPSSKENDQTSGSCVENTFSPHPTNCRAYYRCKNGKLITTECPQNMHYNSKSAACDFGSC